MRHPRNINLLVDLELGRVLDGIDPGQVVLINLIGQDPSALFLMFVTA